MLGFPYARPYFKLCFPFVGCPIFALKYLCRVPFNSIYSRLGLWDTGLNGLTTNLPSQRSKGLPTRENEAQNRDLNRETQTSTELYIF